MATGEFIAEFLRCHDEMKKKEKKKKSPYNLFTLLTYHWPRFTNRGVPSQFIKGFATFGRLCFLLTKGRPSQFIMTSRKNGFCQRGR